MIIIHITYDTTNRLSNFRRNLMFAENLENEKKSSDNPAAVSSAPASSAPALISKKIAFAAIIQARQETVLVELQVFLVVMFT